MASAKGNFQRATVNLDALIPREDLTSKKAAVPGKGGIPISQLARGENWQSVLRKPHFQRETDDWSIDNVVALINSYIEGHLIPAVILWTAEGYTFVIDGAHRLSALMAWVNDDYGDRLISEAYFGHQIPKRQREIAQECRSRIASAKIDYAYVSQLGKLATRTPDQLRYSSSLTNSIETQWVVGEAKMASVSFLAINQRAVPIDPTERYMIEKDDYPNVIAARALIKGAKGHAYWGSFETKFVSSIEAKAKNIYNAIFEPEDARPEIHTELQPAGFAYTANGLRIALDLVNVINDVTSQAILDEDRTGEATARFIEKTNGVVKYVAGGDPASMSLHPAVYFWGATGNHRPSIFLAMVSLVQEMIQRDELIMFTQHRARFEEFLVGKGELSKHILGKHGGWKKSFSPVKKMLRAIIDGLAAGKSEGEIEKEILNVPDIQDGSGFDMQTEKTWRETKNMLRHRTSLERAPRCAICKARLVMADASDDHKERRTDGGSDGIGNAQLTHHFCNHGFKEFFAQKGMPLPVISCPS